MRRRGLMFWKEKLSPLPEGYTRLKYVENTGSTYIVPVEYITENTSVECELMKITDNQYNDYAFGGDIKFNSGVYSCTCGIYFMPQINGNNHSLFHGNSAKDKAYNLYKSPKIPLNQKVYAYVSKTKAKIRYGSTTETADFNGTTTYSSINNEKLKFAIFNCYEKSIQYYSPGKYDWKFWDNYFFKGRIYYFNMWEGDVQVRALVPAKRDSDDMIGMYDTINGVFYEPQGGQLIGGGNLTAKFLSVIKHLFKKGGAA